MVLFKAISEVFRLSDSLVSIYYQCFRVHEKVLWLNVSHDILFMWGICEGTGENVQIIRLNNCCLYIQKMPFSCDAAHLLHLYRHIGSCTLLSRLCSNMLLFTVVKITLQKYLLISAPYIYTNQKF